LKKAQTVATEPATRQDVEASLKSIQANAAFLTAWQVSGPYRQADKDFSALFNISFPPESGNPADAVWRALPSGADANRPGVMDLLKALGGEQCVAYVRTWVYVKEAQPARLELGSDDGVKVWLNGKLVYEHNIARPLQPGSDKTDLALQAGWNALLLKITQNNQGWEYCARLLQPDGSLVPDLQTTATPPPGS
jgi:hypothetical protein